MDDQNSQKKTKGMALFVGLMAALILCGAPLVFMVLTGKFRQITQPFANAAQTVAVAPFATDTPTQIIPTSTEDIASLPFIQRFEMAGSDISDALNNSWQGKPAESILSWNKVLVIIPEWAEGYNNRGQEYLKLLANQRSQEEYLEYLSRAGADFEKAIELEPYSDGDYYMGRYKYYDGLASLQSYRVDRVQLQFVALDNLMMANRLGNFEPLAERYVIFSNILVGNCDEGIAQSNHMIETEADPGAPLYTGLALGYMCRNEPEEALPPMNQAIAIRDTCERRLLRAKILYTLGRSEDSLADLDFSITQDPYYCGERYYLRGLIHAENAEFDKANEDLNFGMGQTWQRGGILSYTFGKMALDQGEKESAIQYFQEAESTYPYFDPILMQIRNDLVSLGSAPVEIPPSFPVATLIPTPTLQSTPRPTSSPSASMPTPFFTPDPRLQDALVVDLEKSIGPIRIGSNPIGLWRFQPAQSLDHREVKSLSVWLVSSDANQPLPRQLLLWNFRTNMWGSIDNPIWGENRAGYQNDLVSQDGDVILYLVNRDDRSDITVDTLGITLILQRTDGSIEVHGITP